MSNSNDSTPYDAVPPRYDSVDKDVDAKQSATDTDENKVEHETKSVGFLGFSSPLYSMKPKAYERAEYGGYEPMAMRSEEDHRSTGHVDDTAWEVAHIVNHVAKQTPRTAADTHSALAQSISAEQRARDWDKDFSEVFRRPVDSPYDLKQRSQELEMLLHDFAVYTEQVATLIVEELQLPLEQRTLKPNKIGGLAGGRKFTVGHVLFKFATDWKGFYQSDEFAQKAATNEIRAMNAAIQCDVKHLRTTLASAFHIKGHVIYATALAPLSKTTLVYGSDDAGATIHLRNMAVLELVREVASRLNLSEHTVTDGEGNKMSLPTALDVEAHQTAEGLFYLVDLGRLLPPLPPRKIHPRPGRGAMSDPLFRQFRPEFLRTYATEPMSADAFTQFGIVDQSTHHAVIRRQARRLEEEVFPMCVERLLENKAEVIEPSASTFFISDTLHTFGINLQFLGRIRRLVADAVVREALLVEMLARTIKARWRGAMRFSNTSAGPALLRRYLELLVDASTVGEEFWCIALLPKLHDKFSQEAALKSEVLALRSALLQDFSEHRAVDALSHSSRLLLARLVASLTIVVEDGSGRHQPASSADVLAVMVGAEDAPVLMVGVKAKHVQLLPFMSLEESEANFHQELRLRERALGSSTHPHLISSLLSMMQIYTIWQKDTPEESFRKGYALIQRAVDIAKEHPNDVDLFSLELRHCLFLYHFGRFHDACQRAVGLIELIKPQFEGNPDSDELASRYCDALYHYSGCFSRLHRYADAKKYLQTACDVARGRPLEGRLRYSMKLAVALENLGESEAAFEILEDTYAQFLAHHGKMHPDTGRCLGYLALSAGSLGKREKLLKYLYEAREIMLSVRGARHKDTGKALIRLARAEAWNLRLDLALELSQEAFAIFMDVYPFHHEWVQLARYHVKYLTIKLKEHGQFLKQHGLTTLEDLPDELLEAYNAIIQPTSFRTHISSDENIWRQRCITWCPVKGETQKWSEIYAQWSALKAELLRGGVQNDAELKWEPVTNGHSGHIVVFVAGGDHFYSAAWDHTVRVWNRSLEVEVVLEHEDQYVRALQLSRSGLLFSGDHAGFVKVWDTHRDHLEVLSFRAHIGDGKEGYLLGLVVRDGGRKIYTTGCDDGKWNLKEWKITVSDDRKTAEATLVHCVEAAQSQIFVLQHAFVGHNEYLVSAGRDQQAVLWDITVAGEAPRAIHTFDVQLGNIRNVIINDDILYIGTESGDVLLYSLKTLKHVHTLSGNGGYVQCLMLIDDYLFCGLRTGRVCIWDLPSRQLVKRLPSTGWWVNCVGAPFGVVISGGGSAEMRVWKSSHYSS